MFMQEIYGFSKTLAQVAPVSLLMHRRMDAVQVKERGRIGATRNALIFRGGCESEHGIDGIRPLSMSS
jgi:hypothetical protein